MKIVQEKKKNYSLVNKNYRIKWLNINNILEMIVDYYELSDPIIIDINDGYELELTLCDNEFDYRKYNVIISINQNNLLLVEIKDMDYIDTFRLTNKGMIVHDKRIFKNNNSKLAKKYFTGDNNYLEINKTKKEIIEDIDETVINDIEVTYRCYLYRFKNKYLDCSINIEIPENYPFVENMFIKNILNSNIEINDIDTLFIIIKKILYCKSARINLNNNTINGLEVFDFDNGKLMEYVRIKDDKMIEYKDGYEELEITKFEKDSLDTEEFQKVLKIVRS